MRSQLLISVEHLPTISEITEGANHHENALTDFYMDSTLDDYVKSIQTLAQPSSLTAAQMQCGQCRSQRRTRFRPRSSITIYDTRVFAVTPESSCQQNTGSIQTCTDPLAWLYRQNRKEDQECVQLCKTTNCLNVPQNMTLILHKSADTNGRLQCSSIESNELHSTQEGCSRPPHLQKKCCSPGYKSHRSVTKFHKPQLPVIYEL